MRALIPFFWQPRGVVSSLETLPLSSEVPRKHDVTLAVSNRLSPRHPLLVAELAGGKVIGDLRLASTNDDVVIGNVQTVFGCENPGDHYVLKRLRFRLPKTRRGTAPPPPAQVPASRLYPTNKTVFTPAAGFRT